MHKQFCRADWNMGFNKLDLQRNFILRMFSRQLSPEPANLIHSQCAVRIIIATTYQAPL